MALNPPGPGPEPGTVRHQLLPQVADFLRHTPGLAVGNVTMPTLGSVVFEDGTDGRTYEVIVKDRGPTP
jgi:hypothetical protein